jgi:hypothetical protein
MLDKGNPNYAKAWRAARISPKALEEGGEPNIFCALEIVLFVVGMESKVDGTRINGNL